LSLPPEPTRIVELTSWSLGPGTLQRQDECPPRRPPYVADSHHLAPHRSLGHWTGPVTTWRHGVLHATGRWRHDVESRLA